MRKQINLEIKRKIIKDLVKFPGKPTKENFSEVAKKFDVDRERVVYYWKNNLRKGKPEIAKRTGYGTIYMEPNVLKLVGKKNRELTSKEACRILLDYLTSRKSAVQVMVENEISYSQFYQLMNELQDFGSVCKKTILDPKKYWKNYDIYDVFRFAKRPDSTSPKIKNLDEDTKNAYLNLEKILIIWLGKRAGKGKSEINKILKENSKE